MQKFSSVVAVMATLMMVGTLFAAFSPPPGSIESENNADGLPNLLAEKTVWVGRDVDNNKVIWSCTKVSGDDWKLKKDGKVIGEYEGVTSTDEFFELQLKGSKDFDRVRLYKDKLSLNESGSKTKWLEMAKGKWSE